MNQPDPKKDPKPSPIRKRWVAYLNFVAGILGLVLAYVTISGGRSGAVGFASSATFFSLSVLWWALDAKDRQGEAPRD